MRLFKKKYKWDGYWETGYFLKEFDPEDEIEITFKDEESEIPKPSRSQLNAVTYIINNQTKILNSLWEHFLSEYDEWKAIYEDELPEMTSIDEFKENIGITSIHIDLPSKEKVSYVGYSAWCTWDGEHGIGFYAHKLNILEIGESSLGFRGTWNAYKDLGIEEQIRLERERKDKNPQLPKRYKPHPVYGLKPSQEDANKGYYYRLIEGGFNTEFINHFNLGEINTETRTGYVSMYFLERACQFNNFEIVEFLLSKKPINTQGCLKSACNNLNLPIIKLLINYGLDINEKDDWFEDYPIQNVISSMGALIRNNEPKEKYDKSLEVLHWMLENGANPKFALNPIRASDKLEIYLSDKNIRTEVETILKNYG
ncbi:MAG: ankyrin repeat domain-containing protein [Bacteroidota bacterium]